MSVVWIDGQVAMAGDMLLGALIDAGADFDRVRTGLLALAIDGWTLTREEVRRGAFRAVRVVVHVRGEVADLRFTPIGPGHDHAHDHAHEHGHAHDHGAGNVHRAWKDVRALIVNAPLADRVKTRVLAAYGRLAEAEAKLHGMPVDDVELHEVGAVDAIIDIVGVCLALEDLGADTIVATPLPMALGSVNAAHGRIPLPAPATLEALRGWPVFPGNVPGEWVTPTGAALIAALATPGGPPAMTIRAVGHGAGTRDPSAFANLVRVVVGDVAVSEAGDVVELACNLDDMPGQHVAAAMEHLLADGALDVWAVPATMKKGRPAVVLQALAKPSDAERLSDVMLRHTTTLGVRRWTHTRSVLDRWHETVETVYGPIRVKVGGRAGVAWHVHPEWDDVAAAAARADVPVAAVHAAALAAWTPSQHR